MYLLKMIGIERIFQEYTHGSKKRHQGTRGSNRHVVHSFNSKLERPPLKRHQSKMKPRKRNTTTHPPPKKKKQAQNTAPSAPHTRLTPSQFSPLAFLCWLWAFAPPPFSCRQPPASSISPQFPQVFLPGRRLPAGPEEA